MPQIVILPHVIEQKLEDNEREQVIKFINELLSDTTTEVKIDVIEIVEEKFEKRLSEELSKVRIEIANSEAKLKVEIVNSEAKLTEKIVNSKAELTEKIVNSKAEMIKWMFIFWIGNVITIIGGVAGMLKIAKVF